MRYSTHTKSISYIKANAAEVSDRLCEKREPVLITQNGDARAVLQDVQTYEDTQQTLALLKLLALGQQDMSAGPFVAAHDSAGRASALLDRLLTTAQSLATAPHRGNVPRELQALGMRDYRQALFKPYRLIYLIPEQPRPTVFIAVISDGRRDMESLLMRRLLLT